MHIQKRAQKIGCLKDITGHLYEYSAKERKGAFNKDFAYIFIKSLDI